MSSDIALSAPLSAVDKLAAEQALTQLWRSTVDRLTVLSIALHSYDEASTDPAIVALDEELASLRQTLSYVEDALRELSPRR